MCSETPLCPTRCDTLHSSKILHTSISGSINITLKIIIVYFLINPELVEIVLKTINWTVIHSMRYQTIPYINYPD